MLTRLSNVIYWLGTGIAALLIIFSIPAAFDDGEAGFLFFSGLFFYISAWCIRYILIGQTQFIFQKKILDFLKNLQSK